MKKQNYFGKNEITAYASAANKTSTVIKENGVDVLLAFVVGFEFLFEEVTKTNTVTASIAAIIMANFSVMAVNVFVVCLGYEYPNVDVDIFYF